MVKQQLHKTVLVISMAILLLLSTIPSLAQTTDNVELVGIIESMTSTTITVNQQIISLTGAELNVTLEIGSLVKIEGNLSSTGEITAREVNAPDENAQAGEAELVGILESYDSSTMVINGQIVDVATAEVKAGIVIGELVKVHVTANDDGTWQAREAEPTAVPTDDDSTDDNSNDGLRAGEFEIIGTLDEIGDGVVVISGQTIDVSTAEIKNLLVTGVLVKVHLSDIDGSLVAREIENEVGDDDLVGNDNTNTNTNTNDNTDGDNTNTNANSNDNTSVDVAVSLEDAASQVLSIYPNTTITEIELDDDFGDRQVWKIETSHGLEIKIDAQTGAILTIERDDNDNNNSNANSNSNTNSTNSNVDDDGGSNNNSNNVGNNNNNSNSNDNDDDDDDDGDNSGMGSDNDDDNNSGMGSDDDD